ncbi:hypothetical protein [Aeromonas piscicola]|uniref:hypothetical protein n=1 Tax=Aeromonas piscicola TaxID=600645 RepID=UPI0021F8D6CC|nr:hypothetical protein [Aeromonas piscicola]MCW0503474.1 hypothetical protein [Aeromonas piscicola]
MKLTPLWLALCSLPVLACGPDGCETPLTLQLTAAQCHLNGLPFLSPDNDTRTNLALLLADEQAFSLPDGALPLPFTIDALISPAVGDTGPAGPDPLLALASSLGIDAATTEAAITRANSWSEGRCISNNPVSAEAFLQALAQTPSLTASDRSQLASQRLAMLGQCGQPLDTTESTPQGENKAAPLSPAAQGFADYLTASQHFYQGEFVQADALFTALAEQDQPWLKETADYMRIRVALNLSQQNAFDDWGSLDRSQIDQAQWQRSEQLISDYRARYPKGRYLDSATGLLRRLAWFKGDNELLASRYLQASQRQSAPDLVNEIDLKLLMQPGFTGSAAMPMLTLVQDLRRLRIHDSWDEWQPLLAAEIGKQAPQFARHAPWLAYLEQASRYYLAKDYAAVVAAAPALANGPLNNLAFSQQVLKGMALAARQAWPAAEQQWRALLANQPTPLQDQLLQLALAMTLEHSGQLAQVFAKESPIRSDHYRIPLLEYVAPAPLLRRMARDEQASDLLRQRASYTLSYKQLTHGDYQDFLQDRAGSPATAPFDWQGSQDYQCPALTEVVTTLARTPNAPRALNCLGEFFLAQGLDWDPLLSRPGADTLAGSPDLFAGKQRSRLDWYQKVIANPKAAKEDKAYALYRAINCYAPSGSNGCGSQQVPVNQRKAWFNTLKQQYGTSQWAKQLKYYW